MTVKRKPDADRLPVSQRIDQRMENPKRRQMRPTEWAIKGELFLNCSCTVFCPCVVSLGAHPPTEGHCYAWMAIADSDLLLWVKGIANGYRLDVLVDEPDVSPLAVQGPKADDLMAHVFGERVRDIRFFRFDMFQFQGRDLAIARSGYSKQGGFEIYVEGSDIGMPLWHVLFEAGADLNVRAGCPNGIERVEGGLLSYGNDMTDDNTPHECGLGRFCDTQTAIGCIGRDALLRVAKEGPVQQIRAIAIDGPPVPASDRTWPLTADAKAVGQVTSAAWSPDFQTNVAIGMVRMTHWDAGTELSVHTPSGVRRGTVQDTFWA